MAIIDRQPSKSLNGEPFEHTCHWLTRFTAKRCDFVGGVTAHVIPGRTREQVMADVAEMIGFHAVNIRPQLNGFAGYDCIDFKVVERK